MGDGTARSLYIRLLRYVLPYSRTFAVSVLAMVVLAATGPALAALLKPMVDGSFVEKDLHVAGVSAMGLVGLFFVRGLAGFTSVICLTWVAARLVMDLRIGLFDRLLELPARFYDDSASGALISKVTFDAAQVAEAGTHVVTVLIRDTLTVLGVVGWMIFLNWKLSLIVLLIAPVVAFVANRLSLRLRSASHNLQRSMGDVTNVLQEAIEAQKVVRVYGGQPFERLRFRNAANWARRFSFKFGTAQAASAPTAQFVTAIALAAIVYLAARHASAGEMTVGSFVSFLSAMALLFAPLKRIVNVNGNLQKGLAAADSVFAIIDEAAERDEGTRLAGHAKGRIEFEHVSFSYDPKAGKALEDISLVVHPGETVALVGPSGSGKTTLANLIPRFYRPDSGRILLDGVDVDSLSLESLRHNLALVSQDVVLFNDTVAANVAYGPLSGLEEGLVREALEAAHALEFVRELPDGLHTVVGQNGVRLSGGQRQRIAIARAFLKNAPILILDEATSSLDSVSEHQIQAALEALSENRTTLVIAHRLSTIERADSIVVMSGGHIVGSGTHAALLEHNSVYAGLYHFQFNRRPEGRRITGSSRD